MKYDGFVQLSWTNVLAIVSLPTMPKKVVQKDIGENQSNLYEEFVGYHSIFYRFESSLADAQKVQFSVVAYFLPLHVKSNIPS